MSGEITINKKLTATVVARLAEMKMSLEILVDCSHARNFETLRPDRPERAVITKPIELDTTLRAASGFDPDVALQALKEKRDADTRSVEAHLWEACTAADAAAFDALPDDTRRCMGMYRRKSQTSFVNDKGREPLPRTAVADG